MCLCVIGRERETEKERERQIDRQRGACFSFYNRWSDLNLNLSLGLGMRSEKHGMLPHLVPKLSKYQYSTVPSSLEHRLY